MINEALRAENPLETVPTVDETGHGTYAASLAAGSADPGQQFLGAAPEAGIVVVKLKQAKQYLRDYYFIPGDAVCYQETDLMLGLKYLNDVADALGLPLVVCVTVGSSMGGHIGTLPLPFLSMVTAREQTGSQWSEQGTRADKRHHYYNEIEDEEDTKTVELRVGEGVPGFSLELWTDIPNILSISIISPPAKIPRGSRFVLGQARNLIFCLSGQKFPWITRLLVEKEYVGAGLFSALMPRLPESGRS